MIPFKNKLGSTNKLIIIGFFVMEVVDWQNDFDISRLNYSVFSLMINLFWQMSLNRIFFLVNQHFGMILLIYKLQIQMNFEMTSL